MEEISVKYPVMIQAMLVSPKDNSVETRRLVDIAKSVTQSSCHLAKLQNLQKSSSFDSIPCRRTAFGIAIQNLDIGRKSHVTSHASLQ